MGVTHRATYFKTAMRVARVQRGPMLQSKSLELQGRGHTKEPGQPGPAAIPNRASLHTAGRPRGARSDGRGAVRVDVKAAAVRALQRDLGLVSEKGVTLAQKMLVGPCIPVGIQL